MKKIIFALALIFSVNYSINAEDLSCETSMDYETMFNCFEAADAAATTYAIQTNCGWAEEHAFFSRIYDICMGGAMYEMSYVDN